MVLLKNDALVAAQRGLIAPSILSADFTQLGAEVESVERGGADWVHVDVMDGHFVPNLTIGPDVVRALRKKTKLPLDCHLMVSRPEDWVDAFADAGADVITVHVEATVHLHRLLHRIRERGCLAGVSLNPGTPVEAVFPVLGEVDLVLVMSVNPGFGGQKFIPSALEKISVLNQHPARGGYVIEVDGGIGAQNIGAIRKAGAQVFVAGNAVFKEADRSAAIATLKNAIK